METCKVHVDARIFVYKGTGGRRMIRINVELHDVDDVIELINIVAETLRPGGWIDGLIEARKN